MAARDLITNFKIKTRMEKTDQALSKLINAFADKFGTSADHLYAVMIRQAYISGIENLIAVLFSLTLTYLCIKYIKRALCETYPAGKYHDTGGRKYDSFSDFAEENPGQITIALVVFVVCGVMFLIGLFEAADALINPEYYALKHLIN